MEIKQVYEHYPRPSQPEGEFKFCPLCGAALLAAHSGQAVQPTCTRCGFVQYRNPAPTVSLLLVEAERVLLGKRRGSPGKGTWALPSGYVDYDEDFLTTAIREAREETGLEVNIESIINVVSSFVSAKYHFLGVYVTARVEGGELKAGDDLETAEWFPLGGPLPELGFAEDAHAIALYRSGFRGLPVQAARAYIP